MNNKIYITIVSSLTLFSSCGNYTTNAVKSNTERNRYIGQANAIAQAYRVPNGQSDFSDVILLDPDGVKKNIKQLFSGKVVYVTFARSSTAKESHEPDLLLLKQRFTSESDIKFIKIYMDARPNSLSNNNQITTYQLSNSEYNKAIKKMFSNTFNYLILGADGRLLCLNGPKPIDRILVDYVIHEASRSEAGYQATLHLIDGINNPKFTDPNYFEWYERHFHERFTGTLSFTISKPKSHNLALMF